MQAEKGELKKEDEKKWPEKAAVLEVKVGELLEAEEHHIQRPSKMKNEIRSLHLTIRRRL